jgi:serine/threonine protein kinase/tetratricopeptide (TPR) repeat protein
MPERIGHYRIVREIGRGGMGVVYEAIDERLERPAAIKTILPGAEPQMRDRFLREARAAAAVSHPHVCQLFEIGEHQGDPFLAMELLNGQSLAERLESGRIPPGEAIDLTVSMLSALEALHRRSIVHRDFKPSNVFLTSQGVKLLDFGLARPTTLPVDSTALTLPGSFIGTPRYMSPEQARGEEVDARTDLFAAGAVLFEMLSGRPAFGGASAVDVLHAVLHEHPPALVGSLGVVEADRIIQRALSKTVTERYQTAEAMANDLRSCLTRGDLSSSPVARATTRLIVLPFRMLRADPSIDFLAFSLPDAIAVSLSGLESLVVRSSLAAARYADSQPDLRALATEAAVDAVVTGTLLQAGGLVRISTQLVDVPSGTILWSHTAQVPLDDLFQVQDSVCTAVVEALALPLSIRERRLLRRDVPANSEAYAHYLQANRLMATSSQWHGAREAYERSVEADPSYAPAWARLGRCLRIMGKYGHGPDALGYRDRAEEAFQRAFRINPDLSLAHNLYTHSEVESGRAQQAVFRLLERIRDRSSDPELYAGLIHACRYAGLIDASIGAFHRARRLDPSIRTSVAHSFLLNGDFEKAIAVDVDDPPYITMLSLQELGRDQDLLALHQTTHARSSGNVHLMFFVDAVAATVEGDIATGLEAVAKLRAFPAFSDPEGLYLWARASAGLGDYEGALEMAALAVDTGLHCVRAFETAPAFDAIRRDPRFVALVDRARVGQTAAARAFTAAGGHELLGLAQL